MMKRNVFRSAGLCASLACLGLVGMESARAGTATFDFQTDPNIDYPTFEQKGTSIWVDPTADPTLKNNGYIEVTASANSQRGVILMPDIDNGLPIRGFTFECDLRIGGGTENPADGFSLNYARSSDPVIADINNGGSGSGFAASPGGEANLPEEGTQTGLGIGFDTWDSGSGDVVGISVRVDNIIVASKAYPTRHGSVTDTTSLQTGPRDATTPDDPYVQLPLLGWAPLKVDLKVDGKLSIYYKNSPVVENLQTTFVPSAGRLIFSGRTGDAREFHHVDNIKLTTVPATNFIVSALSGNAAGLEVTFSDIPASDTFPGSLLDTSTLDITLNGVKATPTGFLKNGLDTKVVVTLPTYLPPNTTNTVKVIAKDNRGFSITEERIFIVGPYSVIPASFAVDSAIVDKTKPGFKARIHQLSIDRDPTDANAENQLNNGYINPETNQPYPNEADLTGAVNGWFSISTYINWGQPVYNDASVVVPESNGNFRANTEDPAKNYPETLIPGIKTPDPDPIAWPNANNIAAEIKSYIELKKGLYRFGFNSDDGFKVTTGRNPKDVFAMKLGIFDGGRGSSDTLFDFVVEADGIYPFRALYYEGGGGANAEFFAVDIVTGEKYLIGDPKSTVYAKPYQSATTDLPVYVKSISPVQNATGVDPTSIITVVFEDVSTALDSGSVSITVNGTPATLTTSKSGTTTTVKADAGLLPSASVNNIVLVYSDNATPKHTETNTWTFTVSTYATLPASIARPLGSGTVPGIKVKTEQLYCVHDDNGILTLDGVRTPNLIEFAEQTVAGLWSTNYADLTDTNYPYANGYFTVDYVNFNRAANGLGDEQGSFKSPDWPDAKLPGIPSIVMPLDQLPNQDIPYEDFAMEMLTYIEFPTAGYYVMGFNSDDGFKVTATDKAPVAVSPLKINEPSDLAGFVGAFACSPENGGGAAAMPTTPLTAQVVAANPILLDADVINTNEVVGKIVFTKRGTSTFADKIRRAYNAGAVGVIVANNRPDANPADGFLPILMGSVTTPQIPAVMITKASGDKIMAKLDAKVTVTATLQGDDTVRVGEYNAGKGASDVNFGFIVPKAGLYPFRALYFQGTGGGNAEWFTYTASGAKVLINSSATGALKAYTVAPAVVVEEPVIAVARGTGKVVITYKGTLQWADKVEGPYTDVQGAGQPYETTPTGTKFFKARQ